MSLRNEVFLKSEPLAKKPVRPAYWRPKWRWSTIALSLAAVMAAGLVLLVPLYLLIRTSAAGSGVLDILAQTKTIAILFNTLLLAGTVTLAAAAVAVPAAWLLTCSDLAAKRLWTILVVLPLVLPSYVAAYIYMTLLAPKGLIQGFLEPLIGLQRMPSFMGFPGAFLVLTCICYPYIFLTTRAALQRMDPALMEAARGLGLSPIHAFWRVMLPHLRPSVAAGGLLVALYVLRDFGAVTMWQYSTFTRIIYNRYLSYRLDTAAALALVLVILAIAILYFEQRLRGRARYERLSIGAARSRRPTKLGRWKWPAWAFLSSVVFISLILPAAGLSLWLWRGWRQDWAVKSLGDQQTNLVSFWQLLEPAWNSFSVSALAACLAIILSLPVVILTVRRSGRLSRILERFTYSSYALPGLVVALALVFFGINYFRAAYQTIPLLLLAYVILFLPQAIGAQRSSFLQVSPGMEEAARSLGRRPWEILRRVTLPLIRPGIFAGGILVFLTAMKELPATLILSPLGFSTLSTQIWTNINEAFFARAALPTLLLLLLSSLPLAIMTLRENRS